MENSKWRWKKPGGFQYFTIDPGAQYNLQKQAKGWKAAKQNSSKQQVFFKLVHLFCTSPRINASAGKFVDRSAWNLTNSASVKTGNIKPFLMLKKLLKIRPNGLTG